MSSQILTKNYLENTFRFRRLRSNSVLAEMYAETSLNLNKFIYPLFIVDKLGYKEEIKSMPDIFQQDIDNALFEIESLVKHGLKSVILFGIPTTKDATGSQAYDDNGIVQRAIRKIKSTFPELMVVSDTCLCEYTDHGHCGLIQGNTVLNDESLVILAKSAVSQAAAGADLIAPSDMLDNRVGFIRSSLDDAGFKNIPIMAYSAKYASSFYGPFREAAQSAPMFGDRKSYQMDPRNSREALREIEQDIKEGADIIMVKPALSYLDIISQAKAKFNHPVAAYNVSGEYSMVKAAGRNGWINEELVIREILISIFRSGCDILISYHTKDLINFLAKTNI